MNHFQKVAAAKLSESRVGDMRIDEEEARIFRRWLEVLNDAGVEFLVTGAFALHAYTSLWRYTKDLDILIRPGSLKPGLQALSKAGYRTEVRDVSWLAKCYDEDCLLDIIFSLAGGHIVIDDQWFARARRQDILGMAVLIPSPEDLVASKLYVARSDRFDGADILHVIRELEADLEWDRIVRVLGEDDILLVWHLLLFGYVYPGLGHRLPRELMTEIMSRRLSMWDQERDEKTFYGLVLDPVRFAADVEDLGYVSARRVSSPLIDERGELL